MSSSAEPQGDPKGNGAGMYSPGHVANFILEQAEKEDRPVSQMKLQKLVYIGYGWALALGEDLFDEPILAWRHGPVVRSLYDEFKHFGGTPIAIRSVEWDMDEYEFTEPKIPSGDKKNRYILKTVWDLYKDFTASTLRRKTHEEGSPWYITRQEKGLNAVIPKGLIRKHFTRKIRQYIEAANRK